MDRIGKYQIKPFTENRRNIVLILNEGWRRHSINAIIEADITESRKMIKDFEKKSGTKISFTGWIIKCIGQTLSENKELNALRHGKRKIVIFDDVDVAIPVERNTGNEIRPMIYILRKANEKSVLEITKEIRAIQKEKINENTQVLGRELSRFGKFALKSPTFLKKFLLWFSRRHGILKKKYMGTVGITSVGMKGRLPGWIIPLGGTTTFHFSLGSITKKPGVVGNKVKAREFLNLTISVDHDIVDGAPLARFVDRLVELIEEGYGLDNKK